MLKLILLYLLVTALGFLAIWLACRKAFR